jgi:hypothetical protein
MQSTACYGCCLGIECVVLHHASKSLSCAVYLRCWSTCSRKSLLSSSICSHAVRACGLSLVVHVLWMNCAHGVASLPSCGTCICAFGSEFCLMTCQKHSVVKQCVAVSVTVCGSKRRQGSNHRAGWFSGLCTQLVALRCLFWGLSVWGFGHLAIWPSSTPWCLCMACVYSHRCCWGVEYVVLHRRCCLGVECVVLHHAGRSVSYAVCSRCRLP